MKEKGNFENIFYIYYICRVNFHFAYNRDKLYIYSQRNNFYLFLYYNIYLIKQDVLNYKMKL